MDPILSWVVCILSAFLLAAGGFLLARAASLGRVLRQGRDLEKLQATLQKLLEERKVWQSREGVLQSRLERAERSLRAQIELTAERGGLGGQREQPDPNSHFERESVPHLQKVSEDEFEIPDAAPRGVKEAVGLAEPRDDLGGHEETRQVNLHSPENVVQFMARIDELVDENEVLRATLSENEQTIKDRRAEGNEQIHRFAALEATAEKLRAELKRRNQRIEFLGEQLKEQLANDDGPLTDPSQPPRSPSSGSLPPPLPPPPPLSSPAFGLGSNIRTVVGPNDGPTLEVRRISPEELEGDDSGDA
jgi:multidrug efflux pump subunit AcrA (membrane-fusion protein)